MSEAVKLVRQSSWLSMSGICLLSRSMHPCPTGPLGFPAMAQGEHVYYASILTSSVSFGSYTQDPQ